MHARSIAIMLVNRRRPEIIENISGNAARGVPLAISPGAGRRVLVKAA